MKKDTLTFPAICGVMAKENDCYALSYISSGGKINITSYRKDNKLEKIKKLPFLRGFILFVYYLIQFFKFIALSLRLSQHYAKPSNDLTSKISKKLNIESKYVVWSIIGVASFCLSFACLSFLPAIIVRSLPISSPVLLLNFLQGVFKIALFYVMCLSLKAIWPMRQFYSLNAVSNQLQRAMQKTSHSQEIEKESIYLSTNLFTMSFFCFILSYFVLSLVMSSFPFWSIPLIAVLSLLVVFDFGYELLLVLEKQRTIIGKILVVAFSYPFVCTPSKTEIELAMCAKKEVELMNETKERENIELKSKERQALSAVLTDVKNALLSAGIEDESEAEWLVATVLDKNRAELKLITTISSEETQKIKEVLSRRLKHEPLSKIFGFAEFYGERFYVDKNVLSPRMETEEVVERALKIIESNAYKNVLDLCTGSGCIAIIIAKKTNCNVVGTDVSRNALAIAQKNAKKLGANVEFVCSDMFAGLKKRKKFDIIVSNPPYISSGEISMLETEVSGYDPKLALDGGEDGLNFYRRIAQDAPKHLKQYGCLVLEIGYNQADAVKKLLAPHFINIKTLKDNFKNDRIVVAFLK